MVLSYGLDGSHKPMKTTRDIALYLLFGQIWTGVL
nr:MAG TPA: hypothetical protein [Caudoviricetes sp.]